MRYAHKATVSLVAVAALWATVASADWLDLVAERAAGERDLPVVLAQSDAERFNRIEAQIRNLTGLIEELQFQVRQMEEQMRRLQADTDFRLQDLEVGTGSPQPTPQIAASAAAPLPEAPANAQIIGQGSLPTLAPPQQPAPAGTLQPLDLSSLATGQAALAQPVAPQPQAVTPGLTTPGPVAAIQPTGDPLRDYQQGYDLILAGNYVAAEQTFRRFVDAYPEDPRAADAQFWIGDSYFARGLYREAADEFLSGYKSFPDSAKAPDTLLKLGLSLAGLGEREAACSTYEAVLRQYPEASNSLRQRVISGQAVANC